MPGTLAARLQHNARTPLNAMLGMVELLEGTNLDETQREYVNVLRRSTEILIGVVDELPPLAEPPSVRTFHLSGLRILLVDDSEDNRFLIVRYLKNSGVEIDEATNGQEAVAKFQTRGYDAVLMDVEMPVMDGFAASRAIRDWERAEGRQPTRILALTARDPAEALHESRAAGCDELVLKPLRKTTLLEVLSSHCAVEDMVPAYLAKRRADMPTLHAALAASDFGTLQSLGHKLCGTGAGYGLPQLSRLGRELERAAKEGKANELAPVLEAIDKTLQNAPSGASDLPNKALQQH